MCTKEAWNNIIYFICHANFAIWNWSCKACGLLRKVNQDEANHLRYFRVALCGYKPSGLSMGFHTSKHVLCGKCCTQTTSSEVCIACQFVDYICKEWFYFQMRSSSISGLKAEPTESQGAKKSQPGRVSLIHEYHHFSLFPSLSGTTTR